MTGGFLEVLAKLHDAGMSLRIALIGCLLVMSCGKDEKREAPPSPAQPSPPPPKPIATTENAPASVKRFLAWYEQAAASVAKDPRSLTQGADVQCFGDDEPIESARGQSIADVVVNEDSSTHSLNWAKNNPDAFKAQVILDNIPGHLLCGHLGGKLTKIEGETHHCKMADGSGATIYAMGPVKEVKRFTGAYLEYDPDVEQ